MSIIQLPKGQTFLGSISATNRNHFKEGTYTFANGDTYKGQFLNQQKHGHGIYNYSKTGQTYEGQWANNMWHGRGKYSVINNEVSINGNWEMGLLNGHATIHHKNGDQFFR